MRSALYYPHTEIKSTNLLKTALLLWDRLEFIVPDRSYKPYYEDKEIAEAIELFGVQRYPSDEVKKETYLQLEELATRQLPEVFYYKSASGTGDPYEIYPEKLLGQTWQMLQQADLVHNPLANSDFPLTQAAGLTVMSILADCCAGETRTRITDRGLAYAAITNLLVEHKVAPEGEYEVVVPLTLTLVKASSLPLKQVLAFRQREAKSSGHELRDLRHRYVDRIAAHIKAVRLTKRATDREELQLQFEEEMRDDLLHLRDELRVPAKEYLFSQSVVVTLVAAATAAGSAIGMPLPLTNTLTAAGLPVTIGGLLGGQTKLAAARKAVMQRHPMAYMYELQQFD